MLSRRLGGGKKDRRCRCCWCWCRRRWRHCRWECWSRDGRGWRGERGRRSCQLSEPRHEVLLELGLRLGLCLEELLQGGGDVGCWLLSYGCRICSRCLACRRRRRMLLLLLLR